MVPTQGYWCSLCKVLFGDQACGEFHLKSEAHNMKYRVNFFKTRSPNGPKSVIWNHEVICVEGCIPSHGYKTLRSCFL